MNLSALFVGRPVATVLLTLGLALSGIVSFGLLPVAPLPQVENPTISVSANLPGASPETMAATVATPLERSLARIAGITEMTSWSTLGSTRVTLQFALDRDINGAARDVQAAINAARSLLPTSLPNLPTYRKVNPADAPILILALTSDTMSQGQMYDAAATILAQKMSQVKGVGLVTIGGSSLPAVRVELNPGALFKYGIGPEEVRTAITTTNVNRPKGLVENGTHQWQILANDQARTAEDYLPLIVSWRKGAPVYLSDVAEVSDGVQDLRNAGSSNGKPSVLLIINRQPNANVIGTVDSIREMLPMLRASIPAAINLDVVLDRTPTIRASLADVERTLMISIGLVVMVVLLFLRSWRATLIPAVVVPVSLVGTFGVMYLCGFSLNNLSLMALTVATGFVVDDAIVVIENVVRRMAQGMAPIPAALAGAREVGFTVVSMSISLIAVFIPILFMGGLVGRLFREFAIVLSVSILISLVLSLTTTPMMCSRLLRPPRPQGPNWLERRLLELGQPVLRGYARSLDWTLRHRVLVLLLLAGTVALNVYLYVIVPKGFFPQQDTGRLVGSIRADQSISFQAMQRKMAGFVEIVRADPAVANVVAFTGGSQRNRGFMFVSLKPRKERDVTADQVVARLRGKLARLPGASLFLVPAQDIRMGARASGAQYQFTLQSDELQELRDWEPRIRRALMQVPGITDIDTDQDDRGHQTTLVVDREAASALGVTMRMIDATLNDLFGQRQVSIIYNPLNQYRVVMEAAPPYWQSAQTLDDVRVTSSTTGQQVPLSAFAHYEPTVGVLGVNHQGQFNASTVSFNLQPGVSLSQATELIRDTFDRIGVPTTVRGSFEGTAGAFEASMASQPWLILAAILTVYIVLGILYESFIHPITILSTLPSAGVGAIAALIFFNTEFSVIALIGVILLVGIVKKNAIMMIDFALEAQRRDGLSPHDAILKASILRLRPIMMTTAAALLGAVPLAIGGGEGSEFRQPLGIAVVGGLLVSQFLTLYTTPVVYLVLDRLRTRVVSSLRGSRPAVSSP